MIITFLYFSLNFFFFYLVDWRNRRKKKNCYLVKFLFDMINKSSSSIMRILFGKSMK